MMKYDKFDLTGKVALCAAALPAWAISLPGPWLPQVRTWPSWPGGRTACRRMQRPLRQSTASAAILITWT